MGVTATTAEEIFIGAGDVFVDDSPVGATMENNVFRVVQEKGTPDLNGVPGPLEGLDYIESETAELEVTLPELGADKLLMSIPGAVSVVGDAIGVPTGGGASTTLAALSNAGATNIKVTAVTGMTAGDVLQIGAAGAREFRSIVTVGTAGSGGTGIDLDVALTKAHANLDPVVEVDHTTLAADVPVGATNIKLTSVAGLAVGDYLRFGYPGQQEVRQLTFVGTAGSGGTGVSFDFATTSPHLSGQTVLEQNSAGSTVVKSGAGVARRIPSSAYHKWELVVPGLDGRERRFRLLSAIMTENPEYEASDSPDSPLAPRLTLQARWNPADGTASPWEIEILGATS
jgi:hypothetical protein